MIVISPPRSGGTKFCQDLEDITGYEFVGELATNSIIEFGAPWAKAKLNTHEINNDESLTLSRYIDILDNQKDKIILCNIASHWMLPHASHHLTRKNKRNIFTSVTNYWLKMWKGHLPPGFEKNILAGVHRNMVIQDAWIEHKGIEPVYYETYFNNHAHLHPQLDQYDKKDEIFKWIDLTLGS